ncbi:MAG: M20/M25/M40 family metallo-hydrolase, partial [Gemmatimonadetes bacterium]|nr:M20/M25/M40 family metallo-hydrolase [Gemmatimonadota bacterium]
VASISAERLSASVRRLESFGTRHTLSSPTGARGIGAARQWILDEMRRSSPRLRVEFDTYQLPAQGPRITRAVELRNVMAILPGRSERRLYVSGHYDTVASDSTGRIDWQANLDRPAPGANDDGSGTALTMELARVMAESGIEFEPTLVFIALAGEEEGLVGALLHAQHARTAGVRIDAVLNNDIVGNVRGGNGLLDGASVRVFSEDPADSPSRQLARYIRQQAARYVPGHAVRLIAREDRFGRGGDHTAFNQHGYAGVRFTESRENFARQHTVDDTSDGVDPEYLARNARVNAAALASLALAPPTPEVNDTLRNPMLSRGASGYDARLRWRPSPGAVAYRIVWREAWHPDWQHSMLVGDVGEYVLQNLSIDDYIFGVAAVGPRGNESLVSAYVRTSRPSAEIRTVR